MSTPGPPASSPRAVLLVHGAWHGAWCWHRVATGLERLGIPVAAVDLPLVPGPVADIDATRAAIDDLADRGLSEIVVCGHSYGGVVISHACSGDERVSRLVYLCAFQLEPDETTSTFIDAHPTGLPDAIEVRGDRYSVADSRIEELFYADCPTDDIELARRSLRPMPVGAADPPPTTPAWHHIRSTYVVCEQDRAINPDAQRAMAARATQVESWSSSHSPFFSMPDRLIELLSSLARPG